MKAPIEGMKKMPAYGNVPMMAGAFVGCLYWAAGMKEIADAFKEDTGHDLLNVVHSKGINRLIDEQTGYQKDVLIAFADWVAENVWGLEGEE